MVTVELRFTELKEGQDFPLVTEGIPSVIGKCYSVGRIPEPKIPVGLYYTDGGDYYCHNANGVLFRWSSESGWRDSGKNILNMERSLGVEELSCDELSCKELSFSERLVSWFDSSEAAGDFFTVHKFTATAYQSADDAVYVNLFAYKNRAVKSIYVLGNTILKSFYFILVGLASLTISVAKLFCNILLFSFSLVGAVLSFGLWRSCRKVLIGSASSVKNNLISCLVSVIAVSVMVPFGSLIYSVRSCEVSCREDRIKRRDGR